MRAQILWAWRRLNANYWFYPALFAVLALALAFACIAADRAGWAERLNEVEWLVPARPDGAADMLSIIASSMIAVASTVFSITIVAVSYASSNYGPRLLTNFMEDKGNQFSLATFIGTFVYALTVLRTVRAADEGGSAADAAATALPGFVPQLSLLVAFALMALSVAVLVFFLNHVPSAIRINQVVRGIGERLMGLIAETYPERGEDADLAERPQGEALCAKQAGYIQLIDFEELARIARDCGSQLTLSVRTGDFVHQGLPILQVAGGPCDDELTEQLLACITQGADRTPEQDPEFLIDELVEIGLRALSPGINDPFTAVTALHWLGAATAELGNRKLVKQVCDDEEDSCPVHPVPDDFAHYLRRGFGGIRSAVATSPIATKVMLEVLQNAASAMASDKRRALLLDEAKRLHEQAGHHLSGPDKREVDERFEVLFAAFS